MPEPQGASQAKAALEMRLWVPAEGGLRAIAGELAAKVAEHLGTTAPEARSVADMVEGLASKLGRGGDQQGRSITFEFRQVGAELIIEARCNGQTSEVRHPLPA